MLVIVLAHVIQHPVDPASGTCVAQVGRFAQVRFQPLQRADPEVILALAPAATEFHAAMVQFLEIRQRASAYDWHAWYQQAMTGARALIAPLRHLAASPAEADFVLRWAAYACATGQRS